VKVSVVCNIVNVINIIKDEYPEIKLEGKWRDWSGLAFCLIKLWMGKIY